MEINKSIELKYVLDFKIPIEFDESDRIKFFNYERSGEGEFWTEEQIRLKAGQILRFDLDCGFGEWDLDLTIDALTIEPIWCQAMGKATATYELSEYYEVDSQGLAMHEMDVEGKLAFSDYVERAQKIDLHHGSSNNAN